MRSEEEIRDEMNTTHPTTGMRCSEMKDGHEETGVKHVTSIDLFGKPFRPPECCYNCKHMESEYSDIDGKLIFMCCINLRFPTKKLTCKRQEPNGVISGKLST